MDEELETMLKYIRLPGLLANWNTYLTTAGQNNYSHTRLLKEIRFCRRLDPPLAALPASAMMFSFSVEDVDGR